MDWRKTVARNLRRIRREKGMSQEELAHASGVGRAYVGHLETEMHTPTVDMLGRLALALGVKPEAFFTDPVPDSDGAGAKAGAEGSGRRRRGARRARTEGGDGGGSA